MSNKRLRDFTAKNLGDADLMVYLTTHAGGNTWRGRAWRGVVCMPNSSLLNAGKAIEYKFSINEHSKDPAQFGGVSTNKSLSLCIVISIHCLTFGLTSFTFTNY